MTEYQKFARDFITGAIARGWTLGQMKKAAADLPALITKRAGITDVLGSGGEAVKALGKLGLWGLGAAAVAPPLVGGLAGHGLAKATDIDDKDAVAELQSEELQRAYSDETGRLKALKRARRVSRTPRTPSLYGT